MMKYWMIGPFIAGLALACGTGRGTPAGPAENCPTGKTIVTLTYDDGLASQIANAIPALDGKGFKGTFFLNDVADNDGPWRAVVKKGHELGAHTTHHPCTADFDWVKPGNASEDYDLQRMARELDQQIAQLESLGQPPPYTFAYPCGTAWVGAQHTPYISLVQDRFIAARGVDSRPVSPMDGATNIPAYFIEGPADALIDIAARAVDRKAWIVFGFHGVGGDYLSVTTEAHKALLDWLAAHRQQVAVLPFGRAAACVF